MSDNMTVTIKNPFEETPDYNRPIELGIIYHSGYPGYTRGAPEDCYPGEGDWIEIMKGIYTDTNTPVPDAVLEQLDHDEIIEQIAA